MSDLKSAVLEDLLAGLDEPTPDPVSDLDKWLETQGIYPGTTRVRADALYTEYIAWCDANSLKPLAIRVWGKEMVTKFRRSRTNRGVTYWISRQKNPSIPANIRSKSRKQ